MPEAKPTVMAKGVCRPMQGAGRFASSLTLDVPARNWMIATCWRLAKAILKKRKPGSSCLEPGVLERLNLEIVCPRAATDGDREL